MQKKQALQIIRKIRQDYNSIAKDWDFTRRSPSDLKPKLLSAIKPGMAVLDIGCGNGLVASEVLKNGGIYVGLDISKNLLALARKKYKEEIKEGRVKFVLGEATKLPFKDNSFDFIFSFAVLHHIPSNDLRSAFFKEIYRTLAPGKEAVIIVWNLLNEWADKRFKISEQIENNKKLSAEDSQDIFVPWKMTKGKTINRYMHVFSQEELRSLAKEAGLAVISIDLYNREGTKIKNGEELTIKIKKSAS